MTQRTDLAYVWFFFWSFGLILIGLGIGISFSKLLNGLIILFPGLLFLVVAGTAYMLNLKQKQFPVQKIEN